MEQPTPIMPGDQAADFSLPATDNTVWSLSHLLRERRVLLVFFRRDCPASRTLLPLLERTYRRLHRHGLRMAGIAQDSHADTLEMADAYQITFPLLLDAPRFQVSRRYGITEVPTQILLAEEGVVAGRWTGFSRHDSEQIFLRLARELGAFEESLFHGGDILPATLRGWPSASLGGGGAPSADASGGDG